MDYTIKQLRFDDDDQSLAKVIELMQLSYPQSKNKIKMSSLKWRYLQNPLGKVISFNAFDGDKLIGHYACTPTMMKIENRMVMGLLDVNTATHPDYRGKGIFVNLARATFEFAKENGFEFIVGVANANSTHGYMKYFDFTLISKLSVKFGWGDIVPRFDKTYSFYWDEDTIKWRLSNPKYNGSRGNVFGKLSYWKINNIIGIKTFMGAFPSLTIAHLKRSCNFLRPLNLYIGIGAEFKGIYFDMPKFVKHSPFNLIFMDLTGNLPPINKDTIFMQLIDYDVA